MEQANIPFSQIINDLLRNFFGVRKQKTLDKIRKLTKKLDDNNTLAKSYELALAENGYEVILQISGQQQFEIPTSNIPWLKGVYIDFDTTTETGEFSFFIAKKEEEKYFEFKDLSFALHFKEDVLKPIDGSPFAKISYGGKFRVSPKLSITLLDSYGVSLTPSEIANTGLIVGFKGLRLDVSSEENIPPIVEMGLAETFEGIYFEEVQLETRKGKWFKGFPELKATFAHAAFGNSGVTFLLNQIFPLFLTEDQNNIDHERSLLSGFLIFEDWQFGLRSIDLGVKENEILQFGLHGFIRIPLFDILFRLGFNVSDFDAEKYTVSYAIAKAAEGVVDILKADLFFDISVEKLTLAGKVEANRNYLEGEFTGTIKIIGLDFKVTNAHTTLLKTEEEETLTIKLESFAIETFELVEDATFFWKKQKVDDVWQEEAYIEVKQNFGNLKEKLQLDQLPDNFPVLSNDYELYLKYFWTDVKKDLHFKFAVQDVDYLWAFIPDDFRPRVQSAALDYRQIAEKDQGNFNITEKDVKLITIFSLEPLFKHLPLKQFIHLKTGNEEGWINASLNKDLISGGKATDKSNLNITDALSVEIDIPGLKFDEPPIQAAVQTIEIETKKDKKKAIEINGLLNFKSSFSIGKSNNLFTQIELEDLPFKIGSSGTDGEDDNDIYFILGGADWKDLKELMKLKIAPDEIDGFIDELFGKKDLEIEASPKLEDVRKLDGENKDDGKAIEQKVKSRKFKDVVKIDEFKHKIPPVKELLKEGAFLFNCTMNVSTDFGPFYAKVEELGVQASLSKGAGVKKIKLGFKPIPPKRAGFSINTQVLSGGGYLDFDHAEKRYAGILSLNLKAIELTAIGLITTKLPNNRKGFSMLVSISVFFNPPIQLSFGFSLNAVGGLIGVNRTMKVDVLRERMISGSIDSVMFPSDPIKNADRIIGDLRAIFPAKRKHYVLAPFLRIAWGGKSLIEVDLGVLVELPFKGRVILLGSVGMYLPIKKKALTKIRVDVLGDFNFAEEYIRLEGRLRDSHIVGIPLSGGFAFVLSWDKRPQFLFSVGGYHPRYKKPERFPSIPRLSAILKKKKGKINISLTCEYYTAITSNSFQIGFKADLFARYKKASVHGYFGFNALLQFNPFFFETDVNMGVSLKYKRKRLAGVDLYFLLSGPKPWRVKGRAKVKIAFIKFKIKFNISWGGKQKALPQNIGADVLLSQLREELELASNWAAKLPPRFNSAELLRSIEEDPSTVVVHPSGYLEVRQNAVPLNRRIEKYGNAFVKGRPTYGVELRLGNQNLNRNNPLKEYFARGQYEDLTDAEKISARDFELYDAGYSFASVADVDFGDDAPISTDAAYEDIIIDETLATTKLTTERTWTNFSARNNARVRQHRAQSEQAFQGLESPIFFQEDEQYYVVDKDGNVLLEGDNKCVFETEAEAKLHIRDHFSNTSANYQIMTREEYTSEFEPV